MGGTRGQVADSASDQVNVKHSLAVFESICNDIGRAAETSGWFTIPDGNKYLRAIYNRFATFEIRDLARSLKRKSYSLRRGSEETSE